MGIFYKDCPHCATTHAAAAGRCGCGYVFSEEKMDAPDLAPELVAQEEKLYEAYLGARLEQVQTEARDAQRMADADPENPEKARIAAEKASIMVVARVDFDIQAKKTAEAVAMAEIARTARSAGRPVSRPSAAPPGTGKSAHGAKSDKKPATPQKTGKPKKPNQAEPRKLQPQPADTSKRQAEQARRQAEQARQASRLAEQARLKTQQAETAKQARQQADAAAASRTYLAAQAVKAEQAVKAMQAAKRQERRAATEVPGSAFKSAQSARAAQIMRPDTQECPNCTAAVPKEAARCGCGYQFASNENEMPRLTLSPAEQSELLRQVAFDTFSKHR